ncbi:MAG: selenoneine biosynthesis selenosugar synthase SenB [Planctomycetota bacterium]
MRIAIVTPAAPRSHGGNRVTAVRWARILRHLGHKRKIQTEYNGNVFDLMVGLHARKSFPSMERFRRLYPNKPIVLALTGTDLYDEIHRDARAKRALELADRLIVLQPLGVEEVPESMRSKVHVIYQSVYGLPASPRKTEQTFDVCVLGHLRPVKDPMRTALASRLLPAESRIRVVHLGGALTADMERAAKREMEANPRYHWLGDVPRWKVTKVLSQSRLLAHTSEMEGGANAIGEAIVLGVPVLSTHIPGSVGLLGSRYPGYFPVKDTRALADLMIRAEQNQRFYDSLAKACKARVSLFDPMRERESWRKLLDGLV